ncbi:MAG: sugar nucleotide-binding protein [Bacteroidaceae bacterium]|nr:sugar nucleotide-binding protein [Bacteroidaceae bacterium]MBQ9170149.1 sugar nucleotide-binding protein [Bacteroidaceae bacterium]
MTILVTGANGQLGNEMRIVAKDSADHYIFTDVTEQEGVETTFLDITDLDAIRAMVRENDVRAIVNCAAWTNVDAAEAPENRAIVEKLNAEAPENLARAMKEVSGWLVQISTDYVFGKEPYNTPCQPDQQGTPTGVYGLTKKQGEERIMRTLSNSPLKGENTGERDSGQEASPLRGGLEGSGGFIIIRTAWLYSEYGKNFCKTMLNLTATKPQLKVVFDQCGTPTYALDLAKAIQVILRKPVQGIYHYSNEGVCSWYDFTQMIARIAGHKDCDVQPCRSSEYPSPVVRPAYSVLDKRSIRETFGINVPYWVDSLEKCIANIKKKEVSS